MKLDKLISNHKPAYIHNPKHFYSNSFQIETDLLGRKVITGRPRSKSKNFRIVAILKEPKNLFK